MNKQKARRQANFTTAMLIRKWRDSGSEPVDGMSDGDWDELERSMKAIERRLLRNAEPPPFWGGDAGGPPDDCPAGAESAGEGWAAGLEGGRDNDSAEDVRRRS